MSGEDVELARLRRRLGYTDTRKRARELVEALDARPERQFTVAQLALISGFSKQSCAVALASLEAGGFVVQRYDAALRHRVWVRVSDEEQSATPSADELDRVLSLREAAELLGVPLKRIRSRADRGTLQVFKRDRSSRRGDRLERERRFTTRRALMAAGLMKGALPKTKIGYRLYRLVEWLSLRPGNAFATSFLVVQSGLHRRDCEVGLAALEGHVP